MTQGISAVIGVGTQGVILSLLVDFGAVWSFQYILTAVVALKLALFVGEVVQKGVDKIFMKNVVYYIRDGMIGVEQQHLNDGQFIVRKIKELGRELNCSQIEEVTKQIIDNPIVAPAENVNNVVQI